MEFADRTADGRLVVIDRLGKKEVLSARTDQTGFAWSPSGGEVWFNNLQGLFSITIGGSQRLLYSSPMGLHLCDVSPDGRLLVSVTEARIGIMALSPLDSAERDLSWLDRSGIADLSSDGRILLFNETMTAGSNEVVYVRPLDGSEAVRLGEGWATAFTADGRSALTIPPDGERLILLPTRAGEPKTVVFQGLLEILAAWPFPDGRRILVRAIEKGHGARLYAGDLEGGNPQALTPEGIDFYGVCIAPDGRSVTGMGSDGMPVLFSAGAANPPRSIPGLSRGDVPIRFTADGSSLFVTRLDEVPAKVFRVNLSTGRRDLWKELAPVDRAGVSAVRVKMTADGKSYAYSYVRRLGDLFLVDGLQRAGRR
jgi:hypothetical protein